MEGPRAVRPEELPLVEKLANSVFRGYKDAPQTMFQEYPDLYNTDNVENIMVVVEDGQVVSNISYLPQTISIFGCNISAATLGGVSTLKEYRGRGYSTLLLDFCIRRMEQQEISVLHVSGDRAMYRNAGCMPAGLINYYEILQGEKRMEHEGIIAEEYGEARLFEAARVYGREGVRYLRTPDRLHQLLMSKKYVDHAEKKRCNLLLARGNGTEGYVSVLAEGEKGQIVDCAGPKRLIAEASLRIMEACGIRSLSGYIMPYETEAQVFCRRKGIRLNARRLGGTIRVIDFRRLMNSLRPYFYDLYLRSFVEGLEFAETDRGFVLSANGGKCIIPGRQQLNRIIFGGETQAPDALEYEGDSRQFREFMEAVFPIPFVNTDNLSCV